MRRFRWDIAVIKIDVKDDHREEGASGVSVASSKQSY